MLRAVSIIACVVAASHALGANGTLYKHSLDANNQFAKYDRDTNTWTNLNGYSSGLQMTTWGTDLYAQNAGTKQIQKYAPPPTPGPTSWPAPTPTTATETSTDSPTGSG